MDSMINLFEYINKVDIQDSFNGLEDFLDEIWKNREKNSYYVNDENDGAEAQKFLHFIRKTNEVRSNKYVGVIHYEGKRINLLPKIFYEADKEYSEGEINQIQNHILWWLSYCRKIKFPNYQTTLGSSKSDFFEVLIYLFSKYTRELLGSAIYQQYEEVNRELSFIKGRLNTNVYLNQNISTGRWHKLNCTYDAFELDNEFNRIIKYATTLLFNVTTKQDNKKHLREILFILDEVSDVRVTAAQCSRISFNPMFGEFEIVRDYCELFLSNCVSFNYKNDLKLFAFLLPMEYIFEDFIFGFIDQELKEVTAKAQRSDTYLDEEKTFNLKPDLWLKTKEKSLIADTKYKIVYSDSKDPKKGISQSDLYQMLAYAVRFKVDKIILFYPNTISQGQNLEAEMTINDLLADGTEILVQAIQLPVINRQLLLEDFDRSQNLDEMFVKTSSILKERIVQILMG